MKRKLTGILFPITVLSLIAVQTFGVDISRNERFLAIQDSLRVSSSSSDTVKYPLDTLEQHADSLTHATDSTHPHDSLRQTTDSSKQITDYLTDATDSLTDTTSSLTDTTESINPRDTIKIPDSLQFKDPFRYKYYIELRDSLSMINTRDSLYNAGDSIELAKLDSLYRKDSTEIADEKFRVWYAGLSRKERKKYDYEQALPAKLAYMDSVLAVKDSIKAYKDSVRENTPRILETFALTDTMRYQRLVVWNLDNRFQDLHIQKQDTSFNYWFNDEPFLREDVNATWLGVSGSPVQKYNFFKRDEEENAIFYTPYTTYSYSHNTLPMYNTKTPYTELAYWGTLFAQREKEEMNVRVWTSQNILPELNLTLGFYKFGGNGILSREDTQNRNAVAAVNWLGKKYMMHAGYIHNKVKRSENGGISDSFWIRDTTVNAREIGVNLTDASNEVSKNTVYLDQTFRIPFTFIEKIRAKKDSTYVPADTLNTNITTAFVGHSSEWTVFSKKYTDNISLTDTDGRGFYGNRFYLNPTSSSDSMRVSRLDNKVFIRLQPWSDDAPLSKIDVGIGDKLLSYYSFNPAGYITGKTDKVLHNSLYLYAGAKGQVKRLMKWDAFGRYTFLGRELNDFEAGGNLDFSFYPFRHAKKSPLNLNVHVETVLKEPDWYMQNITTNHFRWNNSFKKVSTTKATGELDIPHWRLNATFGYALIGNYCYFDADGQARQAENAISVMTATVMKDFKLWKFHLENRAIFQVSSDKDALPLPMLGLNLRYYIQFPVVKNVMEMQIGLNGYFTTKWYAPGYNPALGVFYNQKEEQYGNCPYFDAFVNIQWHKACIFVKFMNAGQGWPARSADYFTAHGNIYTQRAFKIGVYWPFYVQSKKPGSQNGISSGKNAGSQRQSGHSHL